jgi:hypothetical protein
MKVLLLVDLLASIRIKPSCELRSLLLVKDPSIKTTNLVSLRLIGMYYRPQLRFSICYLSHLFSALMSSSDGYCA